MSHWLAKLLLLLTLCSVAIPAGQADEPAKSRVYEKVEGQIEKLFGNKEGLEAFRASTKVEAYRLKERNFNRKEDTKEKQKFRSLVVLSGPIELQPEVSEKLLALLVDPASYRKRIYECLPDYGIGLRYSHEGSIWEVLICLDCDNVVVYHNEKWIASAEFQPTHEKFVSLFKELYPDDKAIQNIK
jgi:hypothetical protein